MNPSCALEAEGVVALRQGRKILDHVDLPLRSGDIVAVVGVNGSGKTTLLHALAGLLAFEEGRVLLSGQAMTEFTPQARARALSIAVQVPTFPPELTVLDLVALGRTPYRVGERQKKSMHPSNQKAEAAVIQAAVKDVGLELLAERRLDSLSGGEMRRAHLARVLAQQTLVILLDEPTTHLDADQSERLFDALERRAQAGGAILIATHDQAMAERRCCRVLRLHAGQLEPTEAGQ
jgi:iron complex transport system ATP-binding protein